MMAQMLFCDTDDFTRGVHGDALEANEGVDENEDGGTDNGRRQRRKQKYQRQGQDLPVG